LAEFIPGKTILGRRVHEFRGCGGCPMNTQDCSTHLSNTKVRLKHTGNERWDNWGHIVPVFRPGELVEVELRYDEQVIYCVTAESTIYPGVSDYINLKNFEEITKDP
jgi:hypothetical protein